MMFTVRKQNQPSLFVVASRRRTRFAHDPDELDELCPRGPFSHLLNHVPRTPERVRDIVHPVVGLLYREHEALGVARRARDELDRERVCT
jgi:hypothetical protein